MKTVLIFFSFFFYVAFVQTDNHLTYIGDGRDINGIPLEVSPNLLIFFERTNCIDDFCFHAIKKPQLMHIHFNILF